MYLSFYAALPDGYSTLMHAAAPTWFDMEEEKNRNVYVSGLPLDITLEEFVEMMTKCGIIMEDDDGMSLCMLAIFVVRVCIQTVTFAYPSCSAVWEGLWEGDNCSADLCTHTVGNRKVKLYRDVDGELKGDALCCYLKVSGCLCIF